MDRLTKLLTPEKKKPQKQSILEDMLPEEEPTPEKETISDTKSPEAKYFEKRRKNALKAQNANYDNDQELEQKYFGELESIADYSDPDDLLLTANLRLAASNQREQTLAANQKSYLRQAESSEIRPSSATKVSNHSLNPGKSA